MLNAQCTMLEAQRLGSARFFLAVEHWHSAFGIAHSSHVRLQGARHGGSAADSTGTGGDVRRYRRAGRLAAGVARRRNNHARMPRSGHAVSPRNRRQRSPRRLDRKPAHETRAPSGRRPRRRNGARPPLPAVAVDTSTVRDHMNEVRVSHNCSPLLRSISPAVDCRYHR